MGGQRLRANVLLSSSDRLFPSSVPLLFSGHLHFVISQANQITLAFWTKVGFWDLHHPVAQFCEAGCSTASVWVQGWIISFWLLSSCLLLGLFDILALEALANPSTVTYSPSFTISQSSLFSPLGHFFPCWRMPWSFICTQQCLCIPQIHESVRAECSAVGSTPQLSWFCGQDTLRRNPIWRMEVAHFQVYLDAAFLLSLLTASQATVTI